MFGLASAGRGSEGGSHQPGGGSCPLPFHACAFTVLASVEAAPAGPSRLSSKVTQSHCLHEPLPEVLNQNQSLPFHGLIASQVLQDRPHGGNAGLASGAVRTRGRTGARRRVQSRYPVTIITCPSPSHVGGRAYSRLRTEAQGGEAATHCERLRQVCEMPGSEQLHLPCPQCCSTEARRDWPSSVRAPEPSLGRHRAQARGPSLSAPVPTPLSFYQNTVLTGLLVTFPSAG